MSMNTKIAYCRVYKDLQDAFEYENCILFGIKRCKMPMNTRTAYCLIYKDLQDAYEYENCILLGI